MSRKNETVSHLKVRDLMSIEVVTLKPEMTLYQAIQTLLQAEISGAPVVNLAGELLTVASEGDLMKLAALEDINRPLINYLSKLPKKSKLVVVSPDDSFQQLFKRFLLNPVRRVIVIDAIGKLCGLVTRRDIIRAFFQSENADRAAPYR